MKNHVICIKERDTIPKFPNRTLSWWLHFEILSVNIMYRIGYKGQPWQSPTQRPDTRSWASPQNTYRLLFFVLLQGLTPLYCTGVETLRWKTFISIKSAWQGNSDQASFHGDYCASENQQDKLGLGAHSRMPTGPLHVTQLLLTTPAFSHLLQLADSTGLTCWTQARFPIMIIFQLPMMLWRLSRIVDQNSVITALEQIR